MKRAIAITVMSMIFIVLVALFVFAMSVASYAGGFNYGQDTYEKVDNRLIVNSLGDQVAESKHGDLGYNDYIPENAFKNNLHDQGYTKVWDSKPARDDVVAVGYMGLKGDPRAYDTDYVLKSEYEALNASQQDIRINNNAQGVTENAANIAGNAGRIVGNRTDIDNNKQDIWVNAYEINQNVQRINENARRIDKNADRISDLEGLQIKAEVKAMLYENKDIKVEAYYQRTVSGGSGDEVGMVMTFNVGKTYAEKVADRVEALEAEIKKLKNN